MRRWRNADADPPRGGYGDGDDDDVAPIAPAAVVVRMQSSGTTAHAPPHHSSEAGPVPRHHRRRRASRLMICVFRVQLVFVIWKSTTFESTFLPKHFHAFIKHNTAHDRGFDLVPNSLPSLE